LAQKNNTAWAFFRIEPVGEHSLQAVTARLPESFKVRLPLLRHIETEDRVEKSSRVIFSMLSEGCD